MERARTECKSEGNEGREGWVGKTGSHRDAGEERKGKKDRK